MAELIELKSVGCMIDSKGIIYPQFADGSVDCESGFAWDLCSKEFLNNLSDDDKMTIKSIVSVLGTQTWNRIYERFIF